MPEIFTLITVFLIGIAASYIGAIAGGGGLISIPFLIFTGLPPHVAIATNKLGALGLNIAVIPKFWKEKQIVWKYVLPFTIIGIFGAFIGASLLIQINKDAITKVVGILILLLLPLFFLKKELGTKRIKVGKVKLFFGYIAYTLLMIFGGFFGAAGAIRSFILMYFFGVTIIESNATHRIPWLIGTIIALSVFMYNGIVNYSSGIALCLGMAIGGYLGAHTAVKKGNQWVKAFFTVIVIISAIKILFF
ncbi:sulfite exporter TauE/SafE family protein [Candidatus Woesearchaeota archaeon]|jgi:uncharacterized protein|nr:sulfite exporter TauE/SafE family protein [Candidatus Woesearchaeota archaeon]MBT3538242.1 sulfite exporter TauE/SafE family protein [Candidatus Woesearchaeota archaeon]MBT4697696.1 sulfite exporter TauE/SafE family protein [Candidatus Woesearchaeota archaeon]MBT4717408.1 sulfite exporter TauE/SafE family protein [Candidatus Woesearchaeota archaeon]MBT7105911.1 sulfite exporter TauE/SafE family protein [Candidatus Woesearchaeota archaeon]